MQFHNIRKIYFFFLVIYLILLAECSVYPNGFQSCIHFFDGNYIPSNVGTQICQDKNGDKNFGPLFATCYNETLKIPIYSAYRLIKNKGSDRAGYWYQDRNITKSNQASDDDYKIVGYDRGHLCPNQYFNTADRKVTNALTNAVPQKSNFNQQAWKQLETESKNQIDKVCNGDNFFITGAIPGNTWTTTGINIPSYLYTAVCCRQNSFNFSFGYIGKNDDNEPFDVKVLNITQLAGEVNKLYTTKFPFKQPFRFFDDTCNEGNVTVKDLIDKSWVNWKEKRMNRKRKRPGK